MNKSIFQKKYSLNLIFGLIDFSLAAFIVFFPVRTIISDTEALSSLKKEFFLIEKQEESFKSLDRDYRIYLQKIERIDAVFVDAKVPIAFLDVLEKASREAGFGIKISPSASSRSDKSSWPSIAFRVSGRGKPENFLKFLDKMENSQYLMQVLELNLSREKLLDEKNELPPEVEASFLIKVFTEQ
ncbi:MAG: hypothetical protein Q8N16_04030 [bacterium]|nr:hypothetical protein [bacterium]